MKTFLGLLALSFAAVGCSTPDRQIEHAPVGSVIRGETKNAGDYVERVKQANEQFRANESQWMTTGMEGR